MANFTCNHSSPGTIGWQINGISLTMLQEPLSSHVTSSIFHNLDGSALSILMIKATNEFNQSSIRCLALFDGAQAEYSPIALLQIQGIKHYILYINSNGHACIRIPKDHWMLSEI